MQTFMSTNILQFPEGKREFQLTGLKIYLAISLPMMAITFLAWFLLYRLVKTRDELAGQCILEQCHSSNV
jgi:hypothetical protein